MKSFLFIRIYLSSQDNWPLSYNSMGQFFSIILMVAVLALMAFLAVRLMSASRYGGRFGQMRNLQIIESIGVGLQASVQIIRSGNRYFLLGITKEKITFLTEIDKDSINIADGKNQLANNPFDKVLSRFIKKDIEKDE